MTYSLDFRRQCFEGLGRRRPDRAVLIMKNAAFHKLEDAQQAMTETRHTLEYLLPYSPDINPIEHQWAQAKAIRREKTMCDERWFKKTE